MDNAFQVGLDEVLEGHSFRVVHFAVDVLLFQYLADDYLAEEVQFGLGIIEDSPPGEARCLFHFVQGEVADVMGEQQREGLGEELFFVILSHATKFTNNYKDNHFFHFVCIPFGMLITYFLVSLRSC